MKNEKLIRAMGEIDEDLIAEAHESRKPRTVWVRWTAMAACFALLVACVPVLMTVLNGGLAFDAAPEKDMAMDAEHYYSGTVQGELNGGLTWAGEEDSVSVEEICDSLQKGENVEIPPTEAAGNAEQVYRVGDTARAKGLAVQYLAADETSMDLHIKKNGSDSLVISALVLCREGDTESAWIVRSNGEGVQYFSFTVNGEQAEALPSEAGEYDITVDFSALLQGGRQLSPRITINDTLVLIWE